MADEPCRYQSVELTVVDANAHVRMSTAEAVVIGIFSSNC